MPYQLRFGGYDLPKTLRPAAINSDLDTAGQTIPRRVGQRTQEGRRGVTMLPVRGELSADTPELLEDALRVLRGQIVGKKDLWFGEDTHYYKGAQCKSFGFDYRDGLTHGVVAIISIAFEASEYPEPLKAGLTTTPNLGANANITHGGTSICLPRWTITIGNAPVYSSGNNPSLLLSNNTTVEQCSLSQITGASALQAGDVLTLDRDGYTLTRGGIALLGVYRGRIPTLKTGVNSISIVGQNGMTAAALTCTHQETFV
jgi:hypothetical protein